MLTTQVAALCAARMVPPCRRVMVFATEHSHTYYYYSLTTVPTMAM